MPDIFQLFDIVMNGWFLLALFSGTAALTYALATKLDRTNSDHARAPSPLWLLVPVTGSVLTSPLASHLPGAERIFDVFVRLPSELWVGLQLGLFIVEAMSVVYVLWRRRLWPSLVVPFTFVLVLWDIAVAITDVTLMIGPIVR